MAKFMERLKRGLEWAELAKFVGDCLVAIASLRGVRKVARLHSANISRLGGPPSLGWSRHLFCLVWSSGNNRRGRAGNPRGYRMRLTH